MSALQYTVPPRRIPTGETAAPPSALPESTPLPDSLLADDDSFPSSPDALEHAQWLSTVRRAEQTPCLAEWGARSFNNALLLRTDAADLLDLVDALHAERRDAEAWEKERDAKYGVLRQWHIGPLEQIPILLREGMDMTEDSLRGFFALLARYAGHGTFIDSEGRQQTYSSALLNDYADRQEAIVRESRRSRSAPLQAQTFLGDCVQNFIRQAPQVGMQIGATVTGGPLAGMALAGASIAGGQYLELTEQGVNSDRAAAASVGNAVLQAPLEQIGLGKPWTIFKAGGVGAILTRCLQNMGREALTECLQAYPEAATHLWAMLRNDEGVRAWWDHFVAALPETHRQGLHSAATAALWGGILGGFGKAARATERARDATAFYTRQSALHERVERMEMKHGASRSLEEVLQAAGLNETVFLRPSDLLILYPLRPSILDSLGVSPSTVREAVISGKDVEVSLAHVHAFLTPDEFAAVSKRMRADPNHSNQVEASALDRRLADHAAKTAAEYVDAATRQEAIDTEMTRLRREMTEALPPHIAREDASAVDAYARLLLDWAQRREARSGLPVAESLGRFHVRGTFGEQTGRPGNGATLFQPLNEGVKLEREIPITRIDRSTPHGSLKEMRAHIQSNIAGTILERFKAGVVNKDTGFVITMSKSDLSEHLKSDVASVNIRDQFEATRALPELMERALLVESHPDSHHRPEVKRVHRFYAPLYVADTLYTVKLTVNEFVDGHLSVDLPSSLKLYHHRLEKKMPSGNLPGLPTNGATTGQLKGTFKVSLRQLLEDVKDSEDNLFFVTGDSLHQGDPAQIRRSSVTYPDNGREVGRVSPDIARTFKLNKPGSIVLDDKGLQHIEERHGNEIRGLGFADARAFVDAVLGNVSVVYDVDGNGRKYDLVSRIMTPQGRVMVRLEFAESGDYYSVVTAGSVRKKYYDKKKPLWESANLNHSTEGTPDAVSGQSGVLYQQHGTDEGTVSPSDGGVNLRIADGSETSPRGSITPIDEGYLIRLYDKADLSTMLHETGHFFLWEMEQDVRAGIADASTVRDLATLRRWLGAPDNAPFTREQHETFARGFERYLREGKAPSPELKSIFARFRQWLIHLYRKAAHLDVELTDEVRAVFNRMLAEDAAHGTKPRREQRSKPSTDPASEAAPRLYARIGPQHPTPQHPAPRPIPLTREGLTRKPDSATAKVVRIPEHAVPDFAGMKEFAAWLKDRLAEGGDIEIASTGQTARFTRTNVGASVKRSRSEVHRNAYAGLREMVRNAEYDHYEPADERHPNSGGQDVYYSALRMGDTLYSVKLKLDVPLEYEKVQRKKMNIEERIEDVRYKDHKLVEIEIAPALYRGLPGNQWPTQPADAISEVSLGVLRGAVKPSRIEHGTLYQPGRKQGTFSSPHPIMVP